MLNQIEKYATHVIKIVIVDDYKLTRLGLCSVLNMDEQINVVGEAEDAEAGVSLVKHHKPDIVLMDIGLPGISGIQATQEIKAFDEDIKVIIYSSHEEKEEVIAALGAGADAYCVKDNDPSDLVQTIKAVAEGAAWLDPEIAGVALELFRTPQPVMEKSLHDPSDKPPVHLTEREMEVLSLLVEGKNNNEIAEALFISSNTAREHVCNILHKLSVHDRVQAAVKAIHKGLIE